MKSKYKHLERDGIGAGLKRLRKKANLSVGVLAKLNGITSQAVSRFESGVSKFPVGRYVGFARAFKIPVKKLKRELFLKDGFTSIAEIYEEMAAQQRKAKEIVIVHFEPHEAYAAANLGKEELEVTTIQGLMRGQKYRFVMPKDVLTHFLIGIKRACSSELDRLRPGKSKNKADKNALAYLKKIKSENKNPAYLLKKWRINRNLIVSAISDEKCIHPTVVFDPGGAKPKGWMWFGPHKPLFFSEVSEQFMKRWKKIFYETLSKEDEVTL